MKKYVIAMSGGLDSSTLAYEVVKASTEKVELHLVNFHYGTKHNHQERKAFTLIVERLKKMCAVQAHYINVAQIFINSDSTLLSGRENIPQGHHEDEIMKATVVPGRNLLFSSILASIAEQVGAQYIALGVHQGDHAIYPDCTPEFIHFLSKTIEASTNSKTSVLAPFNHMNKVGIVERALLLEVPVELTYTCYNGGALPCGKCSACQERLEAFSIINKKDPVRYDE